MDNSQSLNLQFKAGDIQITDPKELLKECIVFFAFPKSRSANFPIALSLAQAATAYGEQTCPGHSSLLGWYHYPAAGCLLFGLRYASCTVSLR
jgi:hypothetical protein